MSLDLTGIQNENEFYTTYYLQEVLGKDLDDTFSDWATNGQAKDDTDAEDERKAPHEALRSLAAPYFQKRNQLIDRRNRSQRFELQREIETDLLEALGYEADPMLKELRDGRWLPVLAQVNKPDGTPALCVIEAPPVESDEDVDPLEQTLSPDQFENVLPEYAGPNAARDKFDVSRNRPLRTPIVELVTQGLFAMDEPPRWVLIVNASQIILIDRSKWPQKRMLRFELDEILSRKDTDTLKAVTALLHRRSTCPNEGFSLLDTFDENSHKHAFKVSEDLKYALRESIELLGNEAIRYTKDVKRTGVFGEDKIDEDQLTSECLRYMYRLLFLFYIEARPELGFAPMKSDEYLKGYSVEHLRDLETVELRSERAKNGFYIHQSLEKLFGLVFDGYPEVEVNGQAHIDFGEDDDAPKKHTFTIAPLRSRLFDPERTPLLSSVKFRNEVLQRVIKLMSLSNPDSKGATERISYASLGINQLGAVYEALLSYSGFFAREDLYEVKKAGEKHDPLEVAYFVPEGQLPEYEEDEIVLDDEGMPMKYEKGTFIYRLAGREREKSASYYTPEVLTNCLVKYALKELIGEDSSDMPADDILDLTVCEPAMGSGAFLNEAVNQLAEAYLQRKQEETGETISHTDYNRERQKVKMYLADNNVFGVDLNPIATELAEVSLWLNTIYEQKPEDASYEEGGIAFVPWFGMQLTTGNSLIGARRQVYDPALVQDGGGRGKPAWMETPPTRVEPGEDREEGDIYHFLLPDYEMANYSTSGGPGDLAGEEIKSLRSWRRSLKKGFDDGELEMLQELSDAVDSLWEKHTRQQRRIRKKTTDPIHVWGQPEPEETRSPTTTRWKDEQWHTAIHSKNVRNSSAYRRLKLAMDYWCALWFWPIDEHEKAPTRDGWLMDLEMILLGDLFETNMPGEQQQMFEPEAKQLAMELKDEHGFVNVDRLCKKNERLGIARDLAERYRFLHWELEYADLFDQRGGFDLTVGNPPWVKVEWDEQGILADYEPKIAVRGWSKNKTTKNVERLIEENRIRDEYLSGYEEAEGTQAFQNALQNYPLLKGMQANSYKCFLPQSWMVGRKQGNVALLHPDGVFDDPNGGSMREEVYKRLELRMQFHNEKRLFPEVHHTTTFGLNIYRSDAGDQPDFKMVANLFTPSTVDSCFEHEGRGLVPGIKNEDHEWSVRGHRDRIVRIDINWLSALSNLYDGDEVGPYQARLPAIHSRQVMSVLGRFAEATARLEDLGDKYRAAELWHETNAQEKSLLSQNTHFPADMDQFTVSGPHFFVATPLNKTPDRVCDHRNAYEVIDLTKIPEDYIPRVNFEITCSKDERARNTPVVKWGSEHPVTDDYCFANRRMFHPNAERSLIPCILPPLGAGINTVFTVCFKDKSHLSLFAGLCSSVVFDFYIKNTGKSDLRADLANRLPIPKGRNDETIQARALLLNCLTAHYADLWAESWEDAFTGDAWTKDDPRLNADTDFANLTDTWDWDTPLRTRFARRQALVELDVLAAKALGLTLDELQTIYRVQFPVLRKYEQNTFYDRNGRIIYTKNRGLTGVGFKTKKWREVKDMESGTVEQVIEDDTQPGGVQERTIVYEAPFDKCDREADYAEAWAAFEGRGM
jgi:hypothetical protein